MQIFVSIVVEILFSEDNFARKAVKLLTSSATGHCPLQTTLNTTIGQMIDAKFGGVEMFDAFSLERWAAQARAKTSFYTFYTPTAAAMYLVRTRSATSHCSPCPVQRVS